MLRVRPRLKQLEHLLVLRLAIKEHLQVRGQALAAVRAQAAHLITAPVARTFLLDIALPGGVLRIARVVRRVAREDDHGFKACYP